MAETQATESELLSAAKDELGALMAPAPEDVLEDLSIIASLFYVEQWCYALLAQWNAKLSEDAPTDEDTDGQVANAMQGIAAACGNLDASCVLMGLLPSEAVTE